jgi:hypothetical protein
VLKKNVKHIILYQINVREDCIMKQKEEIHDSPKPNAVDLLAIVSQK